ncbi:MAG: CRISPR-associated endonuclease Cas3'', partial [Gemmatimonadaceae bacterium]|nr:CRISPR-associated endonuclease Cas3'' [Gemmatimonadaceae bacterium]
MSILDADANGVFWGKLDRSSIPPRIHPLRDHAIDVAVTFRSLCDQPWARRTMVRAARQDLDDKHFDRLGVIALLHDIGKCNWGFQAKRDPNAHRTTGHVQEAVALLFDRAVRRLWPAAWLVFLREASAWFVEGEDQLSQTLLAALSHHGRPLRDADAKADTTPEWWWKPQGALDPMRELEALVDTARRTFPRAFHAASSPLEACPALQHRFAGLVMLADWIGSDTAFFPYRSSPQEDREAIARGA